MHDWPKEIYDINTVIIAVRSELNQIPDSSPDAIILMNCLADLCVMFLVIIYCISLIHEN